MRDRIISLRVSAAEYDRLAAVATARGSSVSDLIRSLLERETTPLPIGRSVAAPAEVMVDGVPVSRSTFFWDTPGRVDGRTLTVGCR